MKMDFRTQVLPVIFGLLAGLKFFSAIEIFDAEGMSTFFWEEILVGIMWIFMGTANLFPIKLKTAVSVNVLNITALIFCVSGIIAAIAVSRIVGYAFLDIAIGCLAVNDYLAYRKQKKEE